MTTFKKFNSPEFLILLDIFKSHSTLDNHLAYLIEEYIYDLVDIPATGLVSSTVPNLDTKIHEIEIGRQQYRTRFGKKDGEYKEWYSSGVLRELSHYQDGVRDGEYREWYGSSAIRYHTHYHRGMQEGHTVLYYDSNDPTKESQVEMMCEYRLGKIHGQYRQWFKLSSMGSAKQWKPVLKVERYYSHGKCHGHCTEWRNDGTLDKERDYDMGKLHGTEIVYHHSPKKRIYQTKEWVQGKQHGLQRTTANDHLGNAIEEIATFVDGKQEGKWTKTKNGHLLLERQFVAGRRNGEQKEYFEDTPGQLFRSYHVMPLAPRWLFSYKKYDRQGNLIQDLKEVSISSFDIQDRVF